MSLCVWIPCREVMYFWILLKCRKAECFHVLIQCYIFMDFRVFLQCVILSKTILFLCLSGSLMFPCRWHVQKGSVFLYIYILACCFFLCIYKVHYSCIYTVWDNSAPMLSGNISEWCFSLFILQRMALCFCSFTLHYILHAIAHSITPDNQYQSFMFHNSGVLHS